MINNITRYFNADGTPTVDGLRLADDRTLLGIGQTWQDVSGSRAVSTSYQNATPRPIMVHIRSNDATPRSVEVSADNTTWVSVGLIGTAASSGGGPRGASFIVPPGHFYRMVGGTFSAWAELR